MSTGLRNPVGCDSHRVVLLEPPIAERSHAIVREPVGAAVQRRQPL